MWWPNSDRRDCNADCTSPGKQRCERGASTDGLQSLRPVLVAAELLRWLPCLRILPPSSLLASSLLSILILMMIAGAEHAAPLPLTKCSIRRHSTHCEFRLAMSALGRRCPLGMNDYPVVEPSEAFTFSHSALSTARPAPISLSSTLCRSSRDWLL